MTSPHINVDVAFPRMVGGIKVGDLCQQGTGVLAQGMEPYSVHTKCDELETGSVCDQEFARHSLETYRADAEQDQYCYGPECVANNECD